MVIAIDKAGRVVIPASIRERLGLRPGTPLEVDVEQGTIRLAPAVAPPKLVRKGARLVARPTVAYRILPAVDVAALVAEERGRWP
jgi:AbrB family looped-hinge helix DNA binding protein